MMLRCMSSLLALSGHRLVALHMSAFGGKADMSPTGLGALGLLGRRRKRKQAA